MGPISIGSMYAPNERAHRIEMYEWLVNFMHQGNWMLLGDWNMVDLHDDSMGHSAHLHGTKERGWKSLIDLLDLIDLYLTAFRRKYPIFMRQAHSGLCFDQARLDRAYSSNRSN